MATVVEVGGPTTEARSASTPSAGGIVVSDALSDDEISRIIHRPRPQLKSSRHLAIRLGLSFALLIGILLGLGHWASHRIVSADYYLQNTLDKRTAKLQMASQALRYSNANSRITMQILLQQSATPELLARRAENTEQISELVRALESQCESEKERQLLLAVKEARTSYVNGYVHALKLLLDQKNSAMAQAVMIQETTPALFAYHAAWHELLWFELEQVRAAAEQSTQYDLTTRRIGLTLQWLAAFLATVIAVFTTRRVALDTKLRIRMQEELSGLNAELEQRVVERTAKLARTHNQLRESLAETQEYAKEIEAVNELIKLLQSCLTLDEARQQASWLLQQFFPAGAVLMLNPSRNLLDVVLNWGATSTTQGPFPPESCWALRKGEVHLAGPHSHNPTCGHSDETAEGCHLCIPMMAQGGSLGVLSIDDPCFNPLKCSPYTLQRRQKLAITLAEQMSLAFANLMLRETLKYQSVRDPLTGLFNRRHMEEALERELLRAARKVNPVTVLMIDIDHFKRFNDMFGHEAGDLLLCELGSLLTSQVRGGDVACRYGGEEFLLILVETDLVAACQRAEAVREQVARFQIRYRGETLPRITVSIGVAGFPTHGNSAAQIVSAADDALYRAKHEGRDRVVAACA